MMGAGVNKSDYYANMLEREHARSIPCGHYGPVGSLPLPPSVALRPPRRRRLPPGKQGGLGYWALETTLGWG